MDIQNENYINKGNIIINCLTNVISVSPTFTFEVEMMIHRGALIKVQFFCLFNFSYQLCVNVIRGSYCCEMKKQITFSCL